MGMSASQARLLSLTARMNDIEFKSQTIANVKVRLADESEQLAQDYTKTLNKQKLTYTTYSEDNNKGMAYKVDLTISNLGAYGFQLVDANGNVVTSADYPNVTSTQMYEMIQSGEFRLIQKATQETGELYAWKEKDENDNEVTKSGYYRGITATENYNMNTEYDSTELAKAEAEYNAANMKINNKEKLLDNELKKLDTEHNATSTEMDSVKNLIGNNIEKSFNLFA